ncbi:MAG: putative molybdenum carrier protein [Pseudomonadota bacterium]
MVEKIISGGQTGVDTAALVFAKAHGIAYGGWVPKGRINEAGVIAPDFPGLVEAHDAVPDTRTRLNVGSSDATLIIWDGPRASPGTSATARFAKEMARPCLEVQLSDGLDTCADQIRDWLAQIHPVVLNVAGPRESEAPGVQDKAGQLLRLVLGKS